MMFAPCQTSNRKLEICDSSPGYAAARLFHRIISEDERDSAAGLSYQSKRERRSHNNKRVHASDGDAEIHVGHDVLALELGSVVGHRASRVHSAFIKREMLIRSEEKSIFRVGSVDSSMAQSMIRKSMPSGYDPMGGYRFSEKIMPNQNTRARSWFNPISSRSRQSQAALSRVSKSPPRLQCRFGRSRIPFWQQSA